MIEKLELDKEVSKYDSDWFDKEYLECFVDLSEAIGRPEIVLSIGQSEYRGKMYPNPVMTAGEYSCISAPSKNRKSFIKSAFAAAYIGGKSTNYFPEIKGHRDKDWIVLDFDTEQSKYYSARTFKRVEEMTGATYKNYYPFKMRHLNPEARVEFIDKLLDSPRFKGKVKLMFVDGIADLVDDSNDLVSSNYIVGKILKWTDELNIHVCVVIHNRFGEKKPTGHLGSATLKKAETTMFLEKMDDPDIVKVSQDYSRGTSFKEFYFKIKDALPYECDEDGQFITEYEPKIKPLSPQEAFGEDEVPF